MEGVGLVLSGGGARAAYQVGAIKALARIIGSRRTPFSIIAGLSAGAINAAFLSVGADDFQRTAAQLLRMWSSISPERVYRTDVRGFLGIGARWMRDLAAGGVFGKDTINYLLDTTPLRRLLSDNLAMERLPGHFESGLLQGVSVSATNYLTSTGISFFDGSDEIAPWARSNRVGMRVKLTIDHVMASAAIPIFFPPVRIGEMFLGDGCIRMLTPMSPAVHMGARRILAIGVHHKSDPSEIVHLQQELSRDSLPLSQVIGTLLNSLFLDALEADAERLERHNHTLNLIPPVRRSSQPLRVIPMLMINPSTDPSALVGKEDALLPGMLRYLLRGLGTLEGRGTDLLSYLAFEHGYLRNLMDLGYRDTMSRRDEVRTFLMTSGDEVDRRTQLGYRELRKQIGATE